MRGLLTNNRALMSNAWGWQRPPGLQWAGGGSWGDPATIPHLHFTPYKMGTRSRNRFECRLLKVLEIFPCGAQLRVVELPPPEF